MGERYDLVIIDCPPNLGMLTVNALGAAHGAVLVTEAGLFAADGVALMRDTIGSVQQHYNPDLTIRGVLLNKWEPTTLAGREWRLTLQEALGSSCWTRPSPSVR
ncbi:ParA family protein [Kocuria flava]|uniref:ParA family protein n=1 Tax=Kocuria flava TaxID=446860 RepID=UPI003F1C4B06